MKGVFVAADSGLHSAYVGLCWLSPRGMARVDVLSVKAEGNNWRIGLDMSKVDPVTGELVSFRVFDVVGFTPSLGLAVSDYGDLIAFGEDSWDGCSVWALSRSGLVSSLASFPDVRIWSVGISNDGIYRCYSTGVSMMHPGLDQKLFLQVADEPWSSFGLEPLFGHGVLPKIAYVDRSLIGFKLQGDDEVRVVSHSGHFLRSIV